MAKFSPTYWSIYLCGKRTWIRCCNVYAIQRNSELLVEGFSHACQIESVEICLKKMFRKLDGESSRLLNFGQNIFKNILHLEFMFLDICVSCFCFTRHLRAL